MTSSARFALRSTRVVTPAGTAPHTVVVNGESIESVVSHDAALPEHTPITDFGSLVILPGLVDTHVHINDPHAAPRLHWEGFESATKAAAAGGITTLVDMPLNSTPVTTTLQALKQKQDAFRKAGGWVDVAFHGGLIHGNAHHIPELLDAGVVGIKAFLVHSGIDDFPAARESDLRAVAPLLKARNIPLLAHAEVDDVKPYLFGDNTRSYLRYLASRPSHWETAAINMLLRIAHETGVHVHVVHLATEEAIPMLNAARADGLRVTVETCPHYLFFAAEEIPDGATEYKCAPPIREAVTREALWSALDKAHIDMIASDHSPCPPELKRMALHGGDGDFSKAWGGISALQLMLPIVWTQARLHGATFAHLAQWLSAFPAQLVNMENKGAIAPGKDADLTIFDPDAPFPVNANHLHHRHKVTPYDGVRLHGTIKQTYLRGTSIYVDGVFAPHSHGKMLLRQTP